MPDRRPGPDPEARLRRSWSGHPVKVKTRWQFNAFVTQEGAKASALALGRAGSEWFIWRLEDGSYDHTAVPDPAAPGHPAELAERFTIAGYGKHRRAVPSG